MFSNIFNKIKKGMMSLLKDKECYIIVFKDYNNDKTLLFGRVSWTITTMSNRFFPKMDEDVISTEDENKVIWTPPVFYFNLEELVFILNIYFDEPVITIDQNMIITVNLVDKNQDTFDITTIFKKVYSEKGIKNGLQIKLISELMYK